MDIINNSSHFFEYHNRFLQHYHEHLAYIWNWELYNIENKNLTKSTDQKMTCFICLLSFVKSML